jgi:hypothetical protein
MHSWIKVLLSMIVAAALFPAPVWATQSTSNPVVVELFTSQGCNSCPPADEFLGDLAARDDVIALSLHVDYWDYIGWSDPYAQAAFTERQITYKHALRNRFVYTPQMVIDGRLEAVGSRQGEVLRAIEQAKQQPKSAPVSLQPDRVEIGVGQAPPGGAGVWLAIYDDNVETAVARGENAGRKLKNYHVVREWLRIGTWQGEKMVIPLDMDESLTAGREGCAILVQEQPGGPILGAAGLDF